MFGMRLVNEAADHVISTLTSGGKTRIAFLDAAGAGAMTQDRRYRHALETADLILPYGAGIKVASGLQGVQLVEDMAPDAFCPRLLKSCARLGLSVFLLGGRPGMADTASARLRRDIPTLHVAGTRDRFDGTTDTAATLAHINGSGADVLLVSLDTQIQEIWLSRHHADLKPRLCMGVGDLFDRLAGASRRTVKDRAFDTVRLLAHMAQGALSRISAKRLLDMGIAGGALLSLLPVLALIAVAIKLDSRGPVIFTQTRIGKDGRPFRMKKFRSMFTDAEARRDELLATSDREGICFKSRKDPRITRVGRFLRRSSLDELPQILNVLRGEMSIVGPRPALPCEVDAYPTRALGRLAVKPGITGIWQVSGRAEIGFDQMIDMDLTYARTHSLMLDLSLIAQTFRAVVTGRGAY